MKTIIMTIEVKVEDELWAKVEAEYGADKIKAAAQEMMFSRGEDSMSMKLLDLQVQ